MEKYPVTITVLKEKPENPYSSESYPSKGLYLATYSGYHRLIVVMPEPVGVEIMILAEDSMEGGLSSLIQAMPTAPIEQEPPVTAPILFTLSDVERLLLCAAGVRPNEG